MESTKEKSDVHMSLIHEYNDCAKLLNYCTLNGRFPSSPGDRRTWELKMFLGGPSCVYHFLARAGGSRRLPLNRRFRIPYSGFRILKVAK